MKIIRSSQYWLREDQIKDVEDFKEKFTFTPKYKELQPVPTYTVADWFINDGQVERLYGFPRNTDLGETTYEIEDRTTMGTSNGSIEVPFIGDMWDYQEPVILDFADRFQKGYTDIILSADTGCISYDTKVRVNRGGKGYEIEIWKLYERVNGMCPHPLYNYDLNTPTRVRSFGGKVISLQDIIGVSYSGEKEVYRMTLDNGMSIKTTIDHRFMTSDGWAELGSLSPYESTVMVDSLLPSRSNKAKVRYRDAATFEIVRSIEYVGVEPTYDISCPHDHNFVANGIVVHNSGKTVMLLKMWSMLKVPALVIVPKSDLMDQWVARIKQFTGLEDEHIGIARQKVCEYVDKKIVVGMIHSLCKDKYPEDFKQHFGLVIFDELHKLGAFTFSQVGGMFPARYRIGATATLRRGDGMAKVFYSHLGNEVIRPLKGDQPKPKIIVVRYVKSSGSIPHWANSKVKRRGVLFSALAKNPERIDWISNLAKELYDTGRQTLVLGERITQLESITKFLTLRYGVDKEDIGLYIGKTTRSERKRIAENCKIIMATTSMLSLGTDIPTLRGLVFATPLADVEQAIGRICRSCNDASSPVVIDFVDTKYKEANGWFQGRLKLYKKKEWEVKYA